MITESKIVNQEFKKYKQLYKKYQEFANKRYTTNFPLELTDEIVLGIALEDAFHYREFVMEECGFKNE